MTRLKSLLPLALATTAAATASVGFVVTPAQAASLACSNSSNTNLGLSFNLDSLIAPLGSSFTIQREFSCNVGTATVKGTITASQAEDLLVAAGVSYDAILLNLTALTIEADPNTDFLFNPTQDPANPLISIQAKFANFIFETPFLLVQNVVEGKFQRGTSGIDVVDTNFASFGTSIQGTADTSPLGLGNSTFSKTLRTTDSLLAGGLGYSGSAEASLNVDPFFDETSSSAYNKPILQLSIGTVSLAAGQKMFLPNSHCFVVSDTPVDANGQFDENASAELKRGSEADGFKLGGQAEQACINSYTPPQEPAKTPEPSAIAPLALLGMFGTAALWKRKQKLQ